MNPEASILIDPFELLISYDRLSFRRKIKTFVAYSLTFLVTGISVGLLIGILQYGINTSLTTFSLFVSLYAIVVSVSLVFITSLLSYAFGDLTRSGMWILIKDARTILENQENMIKQLKNLQIDKANKWK